MNKCKHQENSFQEAKRIAKDRLDKYISKQKEILQDSSDNDTDSQESLLADIYEIEGQKKKIYEEENMFQSNV